MNKIVLLKGESLLTRKEYLKFKKGDTINGDGSMPKELKKWNIDEKDQAESELAKYKCSYEERNGNYHIEEYALLYCELDKDGVFVDGGDYDLAEERTYFSIFKNYGVLGHEKRVIYTFGSEHCYAEYSEEVEVYLPPNDDFTLCKSVLGELFVKASWGYLYNLNEVLEDNETPCFAAYDRNMKIHRVYLEER